MTVCEMAGLRVGFENRYPFTSRFCRDYLTSEAPQLILSASDAEIEWEAAQPGLPIDEAERAGYLESLALYRKFAGALFSFDGFLLHAAVLEMDGVGYAFSAGCGVGKSTHLCAWKSCFGERVHIINGDKPPLRRTADGFLAYGTPWCGKERWGENRSVKLTHLCFLERGTENRVTPLSPSDAFPLLFSSVIAPKGPVATAHFLETAGDFLSSVSLHRIACTKTPDAALAVYRALSEEEEKD